MPEANPSICVWIAALAALLHTSLLLITIDGALAVGGALSVTTVDVVLVSAARATCGVNVIIAVSNVAAITAINLFIMP